MNNTKTNTMSGDKYTNIIRPVYNDNHIQDKDLDQFSDDEFDPDEYYHVILLPLKTQNNALESPKKKGT